MRATNVVLCIVVALAAAVPTFAQAEGVGPAIYIQEFMSDPSDGTTTFDSNMDGFADTSDDEFIEFVNISGGTVDMAGWEVHDGAGLRHKFAMTDRMLPDGCAIIVFGDATDSLAAWNTSGRPFGVESSVGFLGLNNGGDTITLYDGDPTMGALVVTAYTYTGSPSPDNGDGHSVTRDPENDTGAFTSHLTLTGLRAGPGLMNDGTTVYCGIPMAGVSYPGSGGDCNQLVEINGALQTELTKVHTATGGDFLALTILSPGSSLDGNVFSTIFSSFPTGMPPAALNLGLPGADVYFSATVALVVDGFAGGTLAPSLVPGGYVIGATLPMGFAGSSLLFQSFAFDPAGPFQFCFTDGNEIQL